MAISVNEIGMRILSALEDIYPDGIQECDLHKVIPEYDDLYYKELYFLSQEGLIDAAFSKEQRPRQQIWKVTLSSKGRRHLLGDHGYVTVKLHEDTLEALRSMLLEALTQTALPAEQKGAWKRAIESLQGASITEAVKIVFAAGLQRGPELLTQIQTLLFQHP